MKGAERLIIISNGGMMKIRLYTNDDAMLLIK